jgi:hypothetical protein
LLFKWTIVDTINYSHLISVAALGAEAFAADYMTPLIPMMTSLVPVAPVILEERSRPKALPTQTRR